MVSNTIPVLSVADVSKSIAFYRDVLGFKHDWGGQGDMPHIGSVSRDGHAIMLQRRTRVGSGWVWIGGKGLYDTWNSVKNHSAVEIAQKPTNQPWAVEMKLLDPDGHTLWFGTEQLDGVPLGKELSEAEITRASTSSQSCP